MKAQKFDPYNGRLEHECKPIRRPSMIPTEPGAHLIKVTVQKIVETTVIVAVENSTRDNAEAYAGRFIEQHIELLDGAEWSEPAYNAMYGSNVDEGTVVATMDMAATFARLKGLFDKNRGR